MYGVTGSTQGTDAPLIPANRKKTPKHDVWAVKRENWSNSLTWAPAQEIRDRTVNKSLANAKRPWDCSVRCLHPKSSLCSCLHSILDVTSFGSAVHCRDIMRRASMHVDATTG